jgi:two-component system chemotaxis response regulator CheB
MPIRLLIVDDSEIVRKGLCNILRSKPDWEVCGEASDGLGAIDMFKSLTRTVY